MRISQLATGKNAGALDQILAGAQQSIVSPVASSLGISNQMLVSDLNAGQTIPEIANAHGVRLTTVNQAYLGAVQGLLSQAVSKGYLTQDQSNALYSRLTTSVSAGSYPLLGAGANRAAATPTTGAQRSRGN
ncbi:MAG: hypothetical protein ACLQUY_19350 [Ktedonobacterales bacterium]